MSQVFDSIEPAVERFPPGCDQNLDAFENLARIVDDLRYEGYIQSPSNSYQVNLTFDQRVVERICLVDRQCISKPVLNVPAEVARAVGREADLLLHAPETGYRMVVEIEKANEEKILRDISEDASIS